MARKISSCSFLRHSCSRVQPRQNDDDRRGNDTITWLEKPSIFSSLTASESREDRAADPEWHKRRLRRLPPHNRCRMGIASIASDEIQSRSDEHRQRELESQDRRGLSRESNRQLPSRTIHRTVRLTRCLLPRRRVLRRSFFGAS